jgi:hypothetical protein
MVTEYAVHVTALLAGIDVARLDTALVDPRAGLTALLAGVRLEKRDRCPVFGTVPAGFRRAA